MPVLPLLAGLTLAPGVAAFALLVGFDRDRSFYPLQLIVFALLYMLFAAIAGGGALFLAETPGMLLFGAAAVIGFRTSLWIVVAGLFGHGLFDAVHGALISNPGVPAWWPAFCAGYDVLAAACLALKIWRSQSGSTL
ncbi:MAG TPA: hypothetical protein VEC11_01370 [Allosphingosinicella sp.]|nr:hypothetical protein [Allosphingosinicella sp.]